MIEADIVLVEITPTVAVTVLATGRGWRGLGFSQRGNEHEENREKRPDGEDGQDLAGLQGGWTEYESWRGKYECLSWCVLIAWPPLPKSLAVFFRVASRLGP